MIGSLIRTVWVVLIVAPVTSYYVLRILWPIFRNASNAQCVCDWVPRKWARVLMRAAGVRVVVENEAAIDRSTAQIVVANHASWFDVLALTAYTPGRFVFVAKKEIRNVPMFGKAVDTCGHIFIDRHDRQAAVASLAAARVKLGNEAPKLIMFPEGTRSATGELQPFKKGAFVLAIQAGVDIVPTAILGSRSVMRKSAMLIRSGTITIRFGEPIPIRGYGIESRDELIDHSRRALTGLLAGSVEPTNGNTGTTPRGGS